MGSNNPQFTFESFVVGASNQLARSLVGMAANGDMRGPVVIYGGAGKTHLLRAARHHMHTQRHGTNVRFTTAETIGSSVSGLRLDGIDVLLLDDLRSLSSFQMTLLQLLRQFPVMQLIVGCGDLADYNRVDPRLRQRIRLEHMAELEELDAETSMAIAERLASEAELVLSQEAIELITSSTRDPREISGVINQLGARVRLGCSPLTNELVAKVAEDLLSRSPMVTVDHVIQATMYVFGCRVVDIKGGRQNNPDLVRARQIARYLARDLIVPRLSFSALGREFEDSGAGSARHSTGRIGGLMRTDGTLRHELRLVRSVTRDLAKTAAA